MKNVRSRIQPQLIRQRTVVPIPRNIVVVLEPSKANIKNLKEISSAKSIRDLVQVNPAPAVELSRAVVKPKITSDVVSRKANRGSHNTKSKLKRSKVIYQTRDPVPGSVDKINKLKNVGKLKALIIIGNGPSINEIDLSVLKHKHRIHTLSINRPDPRLWPTDYWAFFDSSQIRRHKALWDAYDGIIFNSTAIKEQKTKSMQFKNLGGKGFSLEAVRGINIGRSSVYAAMQIALWMNYQEIFIFGCDMNPNGLNGQLHFYGDNPDVNPAVRKNRFKSEAEYYEWAADQLDETYRKKFYFCSEYNTWDFVNSYINISHRTAIELILDKYGHNN